MIKVWQRLRQKTKLWAEESYETHTAGRAGHRGQGSPKRKEARLGWVEASSAASVLGKGLQVTRTLAALALEFHALGAPQ